MTRLFNRFLLCLIVIVGLPFYWLMLDNRAGDAQPRPISIAQLRDLAETGAGVAPTAIRYEQLTGSLRTRNLQAAGAGIRLERHYLQVFMLEIPGSRPILIDSGMTPDQARRSGYGRYYVKSQRRIEHALKEAGIILTLGKGLHHEGGLIALNKHASNGNAPARIITAGTGSDSTRPFAVSRGVVAIPATGLPGNARLVYARQQDGREFLFAGDVSRTYRNWMHLRAPSRLVTDYRHRQDRGAIFEWLMTIRNLWIEAPGLTIIPGDRLPSDESLQRGFPEVGDQP